MSRLLRLLGTHKPAGGAESATMAPGDADMPLPHAADVLQVFDQTLKALRAYTPELMKNAAAEDIVAQQVEGAIAQQRLQPGSRLAPGQILGLETVVRADGSRPSLLLKEGKADPSHPMARAWSDKLATTRAQVAKLAGATGRVQSRQGNQDNFFGSCFLIDSDPPRLVTNRHVAKLALSRGVATREFTQMPPVTSYRVHGGTVEIEFDGEYGSDASACFAVERIMLPPWPNTPQKPSMDIAVLELAGSASGALPPAVQVRMSSDFEQPDAIDSFCTVGFPASPARRSGIVDGIDWAFVDKSLFNEQYGVKRLAPGIVHRSVNANVTRVPAFSFHHDATTLGGNSGSALCAWRDGGSVFGLHFYGLSAESNLAHGFSSPLTAPLLAQLFAKK